MVMWRRPRVALVAWLLSLTMLPSWLGVDIFADVPIQSLIAIAAIIAIVGSMGFKPNKFDFYFCTFLVISLAAVLLAGSSQAIWGQFALQWAPSYLVARVVISATGIRFAVRAVAVVFALVGGLALIELLFTWHPYAAFMADAPQHQKFNESFQKFDESFGMQRGAGDIQTRAGVDRSEWAFGHSLALGGALALAVPFILGSTFGRLLKALMLALALAGIVATASRAALIAAVVTLILYNLAYFAKPGVRVTMAVITCAGVALIPDQLNSFALGVTSEEQESAAYRSYLYQTLPSELPAVGKADFVTFTSSGVQIGRFPSIDGAFLWIGVSFGWVIVALLLIPFAVMAVRLIAAKASIAEVALLGQLPMLATVALITQWQGFLFFVAGFAVQMAVTTTTRPGVRIKGEISHEA
jgi:hypothetical protein